MVYFILFLLVVFFGVWLAGEMAEQFYSVAKMKGHSERKYFWITFFFPIYGMPLVIALPDRSNAVSTVSDELPEL